MSVVQSGELAALTLSGSLQAPFHVNLCLYMLAYCLNALLLITLYADQTASTWEACVVAIGLHCFQVSIANSSTWYLAAGLGLQVKCC